MSVIVTHAGIQLTGGRRGCGDWILGKDCEPRPQVILVTGEFGRNERLPVSIRASASTEETGNWTLDCLHFTLQTTTTSSTTTNNNYD